MGASTKLRQLLSRTWEGQPTTPEVSALADEAVGYAGTTVYILRSFAVCNHR